MTIPLISTMPPEFGNERCAEKEDAKAEQYQQPVPHERFVYREDEVDRRQHEEQNACLPSGFFEAMLKGAIRAGKGHARYHTHRYPDNSTQRLRRSPNHCASGAGLRQHAFARL